MTTVGLSCQVYALRSALDKGERHALLLLCHFCLATKLDRLGWFLLLFVFFSSSAEFK